MLKKMVSSGFLTGLIAGIVIGLIVLYLVFKFYYDIDLIAPANL
ncbi:MAG TPA: hypothetical protein PK263_04525 [bacterium]|nr:hypothetical protein [bacterium]